MFLKLKENINLIGEGKVIYIQSQSIKGKKPCLVKIFLSLRRPTKPLMDLIEFTEPEVVNSHGNRQFIQGHNRYGTYAKVTFIF